MSEYNRLMAAIERYGCTSYSIKSTRYGIAWKDGVAINGKTLRSMRGALQHLRNNMAVTVEGALLSEFTEWLEDQGHSEFRAWLRRHDKLDSNDHVNLAIEANKVKLTLTQEPQEWTVDSVRARVLGVISPLAVAMISPQKLEAIKEFVEPITGLDASEIERLVTDLESAYGLEELANVIIQYDDAVISEIIDALEA
jgi:hypothetical protein